ncbi:MAG TPA: aminoglycoside phosphotransferase family protein [Kribbella sp.]
MSIYSAAASAVPAEFRAGLETQYGGLARSWVDGLPELLESVCRNWSLVLVDVVPRHGYLSVVWQVKQAAQSYALKLTVPSESFRLETAALRAWDGRAMVRLVEHEVERGAALLQWLDPSTSLEDVPLDVAVAVAGQMLTVVPKIDGRAAAGFSDARVEVEQSRKTWPHRNASLGSPFSAAMLHAAEAAVMSTKNPLAAEQPTLVNHDLHYANVIRDWNGNWVCVDPKPLIGPPEYGLAPLIWRRYSGPGDSLDRVKRLCDIAELDQQLALNWLLVRTVDYALWALDAGLTTDPANCRELVDRMTGEGDQVGRGEMGSYR